MLEQDTHIQPHKSGSVKRSTKSGESGTSSSAYPAADRHWSTGSGRSIRPICLRLLMSRFQPGARDTRKALIYLGAGLLLTSLLLALVVHLPQAPYNIRELFNGRELAISLPLFAGFLIWTASTPNMLARVTIICPLLHLLQPLSLLLLAVPAWWMLQLSVSAESLMDVLGEPVLGWTGNWELFVRFLGLFLPVLLFLFLWNLLLEGRAWLGWSFGIGQMLGALVLGLPLLWLSKYIVVDRAATDRIIELSAQGPGWLVGGALIATMALTSLCGVFLAWTWIWGGRFRLAALLALPLCLGASWLLLNQGLNPAALPFLLGPGDSGEATTLNLFLRWLLLFGGIVALITFAHLIPFRLRGTHSGQRARVSNGNLHGAQSASSPTPSY